MADEATTAGKRNLGAFEPLREPVFRTIWTSSILSNFGQLILGVGAAWEMTQLTGSPAKVALVQSALMLPMMLVAVPAGAIADMFDRRKVAMAGLAFASFAAALLTTLAWAGYTSPWMLLGFCALIGSGVALYGPAWQASVREQVTPEHLPAAVALGSISYNVARSVGPAIGGLIVVVLGASAAFAVNAVCYIPLFLAFLFWRREPVASRLPPERIDRAIISGARYVIHAPPLRTIFIRALLFGLAGASVSALTPILARDVLKGDAGTYGLLLGVYGVGAIGGALLTAKVRESIKAETAVSLCAIIAGLCVIVIGISDYVAITAAAMLVAGAVWMLLISLLNVGIQLAAPRWVTARALSWFQSALTGGLAIGAWIWGQTALSIGVEHTLITSGAVLALLPLVGVILPMPRVSEGAVEPFPIREEPEVALAITHRSGPVVIEIDYHVDLDAARQFYDVMLKLQRARQRNGAFGWSLSRDIANPVVWTERYVCPTWGDYLRLRSRFTHSDRALQAAADAFHRADERRIIRRRLERPFGSVRWRAETPDPRADAIGIYTP